MTNAFIILLIATNTSAANLQTINTVQQSAFNCQQSIQWSTLPVMTNASFTCWRVVAYTDHLANNLKVRLSDIDPDKPIWNAAKNKGVKDILVGNDWMATCRANGWGVP